MNARKVSHFMSWLHTFKNDEKFRTPKHKKKEKQTNVINW